MGLAPSRPPGQTQAGLGVGWVDSGVGGAEGDDAGALGLQPLAKGASGVGFVIGLGCAGFV